MSLQDLTFIDDGNPDYLDQEKRIINFDKRIRLYQIISNIVGLQQEPYKISPIYELLEELINIKGFENNHEQTCFTISKYIEQTSGVISHDDISDLDLPGFSVFLPKIMKKKIIISSSSSPFTSVTTPSLSSLSSAHTSSSPAVTLHLPS